MISVVDLSARIPLVLAGEVISHPAVTSRAGYAITVLKSTGPGIPG